VGGVRGVVAGEPSIVGERRGRDGDHTGGWGGRVYTLAGRT
jgi:hypothetical protein